MINIEQGSPEWHAHRAKHFNASDAAAMIGISPYETRDELIHRLATGESKPVDAATQRLLEDGHRFERLAREYVSQQLDEDLFPVTCVNGRFSASLDGLTLDGTMAWEHKTINEEIRAAITAVNHPNHGNAQAMLLAPPSGIVSLPEYLRPQLEQGLLCSKAEQTLFSASRWSEKDELEEILHCVYTSDPELRKRIIAGWEQLEKDIAAYRVPEPKPLLVAERLDRLPALIAQTTGTVVASNLAEFKRGALEIIDGIRTDLTSDQDFADAAAAVKWCATAEAKIKEAEEEAISGDVRKLRDTLRDIGAQIRAKRLNLDKQVGHRKDAIKRDLIRAAQASIEEHVIALPYASQADSPSARLEDCIRGLSSIASMQNALNTRVAELKIQANELHARIAANVALIDAHPEHAALFADRETLLRRETDFVALTVKTRIAEHKARVEAEAKALSEKQREVLPVYKPTLTSALETIAKDLASSPPRPLFIALGAINTRIAPLSITAEGLKTLGFEIERTEKGAKLYNAEDLPKMVGAMIDLLKRS